MPNEKHFFLGERTMYSDAGDQVFTRIAEGLYVIC
jgi:hypothetical protein